ncbi:alpha/beta hydrolase [Gordonia rhizosphera]|uniref:alpha/beta hydrolase n=1 Tax=Gordonia rhizosphera TaxID=83341 RepID=UPI0003107FC1|nr:alpha/beta fold hydrolase [Gordonia rhizosphera]
MKSVSLRIEVGATISAAVPQQIAGTVYYPEEFEPGEHPLVIFAAPGGGYSQHYYNMHFDGHEGYSEAEYHTARDIVFITMDHLGVGESSLELTEQLSIEQAADTNDAFVREVVTRLEKGSVAADLPPLASPFVVGVGQSMGGGVTIVMQSRNRTFDAIVALGKSALHSVLPQPTFDLFDVQRSIFYFSRTTPLNELSIRLTSDRIPDFLYPFHWPEEPEDVVAEDMKGGYPARQEAPVFGSATTPTYAVAMMSPAFLTPDAARIEVPVLVAGGERDVMPDARREPTAFINSSDVSVFIAPRMAHMHNFAPTRRLLWQRVAEWSQMQARREVA